MFEAYQINIYRIYGYVPKCTTDIDFEYGSSGPQLVQSSDNGINRSTCCVTLALVLLFRLAKDLSFDITYFLGYFFYFNLFNIV